MKLTTKQIKFLKAQAHKLKPVVILGNAGLTDAVLNEIEARIEHHELIKVRLNADNRENRLSMIEKIAASVHANLISTIGHIAIFYRPAKTPAIKLP
jgi:RNA-binding protein